ncbi:MAG: class II fructose-bisphosphate aldolase [Solirubrobacterales bacterium]|nr:class II fructose-bisphosphate aldolase [Solirubrobacterales bacterium]
MALISTGQLVSAAQARQGAALAFNVIGLEHAEAIVAGAEAAGEAVILQVSENTITYHGGLAGIGSAMVGLARQSWIDIAVHLDHATSPGLVFEAIGLGFGSVMFDAAALSYADNVANTVAVAAEAQAQGVWVEAELGEIGGKDGNHEVGVGTDPAEAAAYVAATGVDGLAVAVGTSHAMVSTGATLDFELIARLREAVPVPLVLHGASGVSEPDMLIAAAHGIAKINVATRLNVAFSAALRRALAERPEAVDPRAYLGAGRAAVRDEVAGLLTRLASRATT